jgi:hypothetical protein
MKLYHALMAGLIACSFAIAQDTAATAAAPKATPKAKKAEVVKQVSGTIVSVDAIANTIIVTPKGKKADDTLSTTDKTVVMPKGKTVADLKADDKVTVFYKVEDGKMIATKILLKVAPMPKKVAAPAAPAAPATGSTGQ